MTDWQIINSEEFTSLRDINIALVTETSFLMPYARVLSVLAKNRGINISNFISILLIYIGISPTQGYNGIVTQDVFVSLRFIPIGLKK